MISNILLNQFLACVSWGNTRISKNHASTQGNTKEVRIRRTWNTGWLHIVH